MLHHVGGKERLAQRIEWREKRGSQGCHPGPEGQGRVPSDAVAHAGPVPAVGGAPSVEDGRQQEGQQQHRFEVPGEPDGLRAQQ